ncbi:hypothetical protein AXG93_2091s1160 [Marchantia polymorpha subsp. ruderalis]|uniref:Uncharacterized protein n=1 Tax=Marchantia polymorpha subsp. ruderalis TaxID=1480154 RepID=A0A176W6P4_MARPO|nr:hypothetical protein AXG93_2091s1160 [Marchantia polymorpha subsp. ruderalis]
MGAPPPPGFRLLLDSPRMLSAGMERAHCDPRGMTNLSTSSRVPEYNDLTPYALGIRSIKDKEYNKTNSTEFHWLRGIDDTFKYAAAEEDFTLLLWPDRSLQPFAV